MGQHDVAPLVYCGNCVGPSGEEKVGHLGVRVQCDRLRGTSARERHQKKFGTGKFTALVYKICGQPRVLGGLRLMADSKAPNRPCEKSVDG
jgi:hypothetical protein